MKRKAIVLDCDDAILKYLEGLLYYIHKYYDFRPEGQPDDYILSGWIGCTDEQCIEILENFNYFSHEFGLLKPIDSYVIGELKRLHEKDIDLIILSKCGNKGHSQVLRMVNLKNIFGDIFKEYILIDPLESKRYYLNRLKEEYDVIAFVDDNMDNVKVGIQLGLNTIMYKRNHNFKMHSVPYAYDNWLQIGQYLNTL